MSNKYPKFQIYLGDAVYAEWDGYHVWLKTSNPRNPDNAIALDVHVQEALMRYLNQLPQRIREDDDNNQT